MLTNLSWLEPGQTFPPLAEKERLDAYKQNEKLFLTKHSEVWKSSFDKLASLYRKRGLDVETVLNYHQLLSKKTADFVCSEPPVIEFDGEAGNELETLLNSQSFFSLLYEAIIDVSRFGNGVLKVVDKRATIIFAGHWFPVVAPNDLKYITHHVVAYPINPNNSGKFTQLYVEIHTPGAIETRTYGFDSRNGVAGVIMELVESETTTIAALTDFAVFPLSNVTHSGSIFGLDDYAIINSIIAKIMWRLHCADSIMDKHSEPSVTGPSSALEKDERTGLWLFKAGNYFARDTNESPDVDYVTWDGNLDSNFREIELLLNQLYILSEMGAAFTEGSSDGAASSGTALKLRLVSPRIKAQRIAGINDAMVRAVIVALAGVNGLHIDDSRLTLSWQDGLPDDPVEDANRRAVETGGKPTKSQYSAIKERGLSDAETEAELEQIRLEDAAAAPNLLGIVDRFEDDEDLDDGDTA